VGSFGQQVAGAAAGNGLRFPINLTSAFTLWSARHTVARARLRVLWTGTLLVLGWLLLRRLTTLGEVEKAWSRSLELGPSLLLLLAMPAVGHFVKMLGWRNLLPRSDRPGLARAYAAFVAAQGINELGFSVLGEPLKVMVLPPRARSAGVQAVVADNLSALAALLALVVTLLVWGLVAVPFVLATLISLLWLRRGRERERSLLFAFGAHYLGKLWLVAEIALGLQLLGEASLVPAVQLALAWLGAAALGAPVPGQLGVVEAALVHSGTALGVAAPSLLALALIRRVRGVIWSVLGLLLAARIVHHQRGGASDVSTSIA
jgi:hypothetical protein